MTAHSFVVLALVFASLSVAWCSPAQVNSQASGRAYINSDPEESCTAFPCLIFEDNFDKFDLATWEHEITGDFNNYLSEKMISNWSIVAGGGGNGEFQYYINNRTNSYVQDGTLFIKPVSHFPSEYLSNDQFIVLQTLADDRWGDHWPYYGTLDLWGAQPADQCTGNAWCATTPLNFEFSLHRYMFLSLIGMVVFVYPVAASLSILFSRLASELFVLSTSVTAALNSKQRCHEVTGYGRQFGCCRRIRLTDRGRPVEKLTCWSPEVIQTLTKRTQVSTSEQTRLSFTFGNFDKF